MGFLPPLHPFSLSASPLKFETSRVSDQAVLPRVQNSGEEAGKNFPSFGGHQCAICKGLTFPFSLAGNDSVLNSVNTLCSFPPWGLCKNSFYIGNKLVLEPFWG